MTRYALIGTVLTAVTLFVWQSISNAAIPWHSAQMTELSPAGVQALHAAAPANGLYFAKEGILAAVHTTPDLADQSKAMGVPLARQFVLDLVLAALLAWAVARLPRRGALSAALTLAVIAAAFGGVLALSDWNWYGFPFGFELVNTVDSAIQGFLAGLVLAWALARFTTERAAEPGPLSAIATS